MGEAVKAPWTGEWNAYTAPNGETWLRRVYTGEDGRRRTEFVAQINPLCDAPAYARFLRAAGDMYEALAGARVAVASVEWPNQRQVFNLLEIMDAALESANPTPTHDHAVGENDA